MAENMQNRGIWTKPTGPRRNTGRKKKRHAEAGDEDENVIETKDGRKNKRLREAGDKDEKGKGLWMTEGGYDMVKETEDQKSVSAGGGGSGGGGGGGGVLNLKISELNQDLKESWSSEPGFGKGYINQLPPETLVLTLKNAAVFASPERRGVRKVDILVREHDRGKGEGGACFRAAANELLRGSCRALQLDHVCEGNDFLRLLSMVQKLPGGMVCKPTIGGFKPHGTWMIMRVNADENTGGGGGGGGGSEEEEDADDDDDDGEEEEEKKKGKRKRARAISESDEEEEEAEEAEKEEEKGERKRVRIESDKASDDE